MAKNRIAKPQYNWNNWNNYFKHAGFMFCFCRLLFVIFLRVLCSLYNYIMNKNPYLAQGVLLEHFGKVTFHSKYTERKVSSSFIFVIFKILTQSSHRMWKTRLQILCIIFESPFGIIISKIPNLCFDHQTTHLRFYANYMHLRFYPNATMDIVSLFRSRSILEVL